MSATPPSDAPDPRYSGHSYSGKELLDAELPAAPYPLARAWVDAALARSQSEPDVFEPLACSVATVDAMGTPDVRTVLMRFFDERGPGFVTNTLSAKGLELADNPRIALAITWPAMFRAIRFRGTAVPLDRDEVTEYFQTRPWGSRVGAWASHQSQPIGQRADLLSELTAYEEKYPDHGQPDDVPVPSHWGGYRVVAETVEFWAGQPSRLHDRIRYAKSEAGSLADPVWSRVRLQP